MGDVVLFLHGFQWRGVIAPLASQRRCLAPDLLHLGYTRVKPGRSITATDQVNRLLSLLDILQIASVDIVGNDSGTGIAQLFVARFPERVKALLLTNGDVETDCPPQLLIPFIKMAQEGRFTDTALDPRSRTKRLPGPRAGLWV